MTLQMRVPHHNGARMPSAGAWLSFVLTKKRNARAGLRGNGGTGSPDNCHGGQFAQSYAIRAGAKRLYGRSQQVEARYQPSHPALYK